MVVAAVSNSGADDYDDCFDENNRLTIIKNFLPITTYQNSNLINLNFRKKKLHVVGSIFVNFMIGVILYKMHDHGLGF